MHCNPQNKKFFDVTIDSWAGGGSAGGAASSYGRGGGAACGGTAHMDGAAAG